MLPITKIFIIENTRTIYIVKIHSYGIDGFFTRTSIRYWIHWGIVWRRMPSFSMMIMPFWSTSRARFIPIIISTIIVVSSISLFRFFYLILMYISFHIYLFIFIFNVIFLFCLMDYNLNRLNQKNTKTTANFTSYLWQFSFSNFLWDLA